MPKAVIMPKFEMAQETGTVSRWLKTEGDPVEAGEPILEIETDKVNMEVEAPSGGILAGISAGPGETLPIGTVIAYILKPGETLPQPAVAPPTAPPANVAAANPARRATPVAERMAESHRLDLSTVQPGGLSGRVTKTDVAHHLAQQAGGQPWPPEPGLVGKIKAVPAARRLARELAVDLETVAGTGPGGRIQSGDVRLAATPPPPVAPTSLPIRRTIPLSGMRRAIAGRMAASVQTAPQFIVSMDVDMGRAQQVVEEARLAPAETRVTLTALLVKACAWTLARHPGLNATFNADQIVEWASINIGVAVAVESGLIVPVIHGAAGLTLPEIAKNLADLGSRAKSGQLRPMDIQGGTFTISNLGMFGVDHFTAIINPPEAAILAVSRAAKRAVVTNDDRIVIKTLANFTLTADHRLVDGAMAGNFLADLKQAIERPGVLL